MVSACKVRYEPPELTTNISYLVVDGVLNNSSDSTFIRLSRTRKLDSNLLNSGERNAEITVEDNSGNTLYHFAQLNNDGVYTVPTMSLSYGNEYRLRIKTSNGNEYLSDEIPVQQSPRIDSISWRKTDKGVTIFSNTHDSLGTTKYYRWEYTETWQYYAAYISLYKYQDYGMLVIRPIDEYIYECWKTQDSKSLLLASSQGLSADIIYENPVRFIQSNSIELEKKYSIFVKQYTLTKEAFDYMKNLKKNTELTGSIFDAQPSELAGNVHAVNNPNEPVIGFITACTIDSKRIYIRKDEVEPWNYIYRCTKFRAPTFPAKAVAYYFDEYSGNIPIDFAHTDVLPDSMLASAKECVDCRVQGGVLKKPDFWQ